MIHRPGGNPIVRISRVLLAARITLLRRLYVFLALLLCGLPAAFASEAALRQIYLYQSPATAAFFKANEANYNDLLAHWRVYLKKYGTDFREVTRAQLFDALEPGVLVLGSAVLLDDQERRSIKEFAERGGSVLATWGTGARDGAGHWKGFGFLAEEFGVKVVGEITSDSERWFMMPFGGGPVTWPLPAGRRMYMGKTAESLLRIESRQLAARFMDWNRAPDFAVSDGAIAYQEENGSRKLYLGFAESSWDYHTPDDMTKMFDAMFAWLRREPRIHLSAWPDGRTATQLLEMDTEAMFEHGANFARDLDGANIRGTFYSLTSEAIKHPDLVRSLLKRGHEIAYHADIHIGFQNQKPEEQEKRIINMLDQMRGIVGPDLSRSTGFRAPTESYDATTEILLRRYGMRHHAADPSSTEDRLPFFSRSEKTLGTDQALVVLPRTNADDITFRMAGMNNARIEQHLLRDFEHVVEMGAFGLLSVHSQNYGAGGPMTLTMPSLFKRIAEVRNQVWFPRADEVEAWWRNRARASWQASKEDQWHVVDFNVRAPGVASGLSFFVTHPRSGHPPLHVEMQNSGTVTAEIRPVDAFRSAIVLGTLAPGSYRIRVRF